MTKKNNLARIGAWLFRNRFAAILAVVFAAYLFFHVQKMSEIGFNGIPTPVPDELYLTSYPKEVAGIASFTVFSTSSSDCSLCNSSAVGIKKGENTVQFNPDACGREVTLGCGERAVSFSFQRVAVAPRESVHASAAISVANRTLFVAVSGEARTNGYRQMEILIDGERAAAPLYSFNGTFSVLEKVPIAPGSHVVEVRFLDRTIASEEVEAPYKYPVFALLAAVLSLAIAFAYRAGAVARAAAAPLLIVASLVVSFRLAEFGMDWLVPCALAGYLACLLTSKKPEGQQAKPEGGLLAEALMFGIAFAAVIAIYSLFISSYDIWGAYYFRHAQTTFEHGTTNYFDELSYLGRQSTYPPVFFEFAAQVAGIFGQASFEAVRLPLDIALAFAFAASTYLLFRKMEPKSRVLAALMFVSQWAILLTATGIGLHILAFTLLNISLILALSNPVASISALGLAFATHPLVLPFFPFYLYTVMGFKLDLKRLLAWPAFAAAISLPFYLPIFLRAGLPYEIVPGQWGYLLSYGLDGMRFDFQFLLPLLAGCALYGIIANRYRLPSALLLVLLVFNATISLRADLIVAMFGAGLFPLVFAKELRGKIAFPTLLALFIAPNFLLGAVVLSGTGYYCTWGLANEMCAAPMGYVSQHVPSGSAVAIDPIYGHLEAWLGRRPVLADLYVEYAEYPKWKAENDFAWNLDTRAAEQYGVEVFILHDYYRTPRSVPFDRVYDSGYMRIFRKSGQAAAGSGASGGGSL